MRRVLEWVRGWGWRAPAALAVLSVACSALWWGPRVLSHMSYFQVRRVEVYGRHYLQPRDVLARLRIDTTTSIWTDLAVLERRVAAHPQVRAVHIERKLPGTLVVHVTENLPVAFVPASSSPAPRAASGGAGLRVVAADGRALPIDPSRSSVDVPLLPGADPALLRLLADVQGRFPRLFDQISSARRTGRDEIALALPSLMVRAPGAVTAERLADILPVEADLARRHARVAELDLRFRDQVIARLQ